MCVLSYRDSKRDREGKTDRETEREKREREGETETERRSGGEIELYVRVLDY